MNTITECISGNTIARMNPFQLLDSSRSDLSFTYRKVNKIIQEHIVIRTKATKYCILSNNEMKSTITECISGNTIARMNSRGCIGFLSDCSFFSIKNIR